MKIIKNEVTILGITLSINGKYEDLIRKNFDENIIILSTGRHVAPKLACLSY
jgi:hypothetical protein